MKKIFSIISLSFLLTVYAQEGMGANLNELGTDADGLRQRRFGASDGDGGTFCSKAETPAVRNPVVGHEQTATSGSGWNEWPWNWFGGSPSVPQEPVEQPAPGSTVTAAAEPKWLRDYWLWAPTPAAPAPVALPAAAPANKSLWNLWGLWDRSAPSVDSTKTVVQVPTAEPGEASARGGSARTVGRSRLLPETPSLAPHQSQAEPAPASQSVPEGQEGLPASQAAPETAGWSLLDYFGLGAATQAPGKSPVPAPAPAAAPGQPEPAAPASAPGPATEGSGWGWLMGSAPAPESAPAPALPAEPLVV